MIMRDLFSLENSWTGRRRVVLGHPRCGAFLVVGAEYSLETELVDFFVGLPVETR